MAAVNMGSSQVVVVPPGKTLKVVSAGEAYVDRIQNLPDAGYASDRIVGGELVYIERDLEFIVCIRAIKGDVEYTVTLPVVSAGDIAFRRAESGVIDALVERATGEVIPIGGGDGFELPVGTNGQVLKHNGKEWAAGADGNTIYTAVTKTADGLMTAADKGKLDGIAVSATANDTDSNLKDRANHTGTQAINTIAGLQAALDAKQASGDYVSASDLAGLAARVAALENANV